MNFVAFVFLSNLGSLPLSQLYFKAQAANANIKKC